jgi:hypothetical protein
MPQKPDKFGLKFWVLCDTKSKFVLNSIPYLGANEHRPAISELAHHVVMSLMQPYFKFGHNVTCDNFFTSNTLAEDLKKEKTSIVGTIRKNRRELPNTLPAIETSLIRYDSKFLVNKENNFSLTIYKCKPNKAVCLFSSMHPTCKFSSPPKKVPETIQYYNQTKYGVDIFDQMSRKYTTKAGSRRWPIAVFYNLLDICGINSWILYKECTGSKISRRNFLLKLGEELCLIHSQNFNQVLPPPMPPTKTSTEITRKKCQVSNHHNKTTMRCSICGKLCCGQCASKTVITCKFCVSDA